MNTTKYYKSFLTRGLTTFFISMILMNCQGPVTEQASNAEPDVSGAYYDWTQTMEPETPWNFDYNQTLVTKLFLCSRDGEGNVDQVYLTFEEVLEVVRKLDNLTLGLPKIVYLVGWQYNGHDSKYPSWAEVNAKLKRDQDDTALQSLKWLMREAKQYNTTISLHLNMIDAFEDSPLWDEYFKKDIIAKDSAGNPIPGEVFWDMQSYQISYAREWELGYAQKRIDGLLEMLPELKEAGTIHIDAFHSMRPSGVGEVMSPYLDYTMEEEISTQRKIFRYWQAQGLDVTCEGAMYWLRKDPFIGLQAMAWHFNMSNFRTEEWMGKPDEFLALPVQFSAYTPMHSEGEIQKDPENLSGLPAQFSLRVVPWYYRRNRDVARSGDVIISEDLVVCPVLWQENTLLVYSKDEALPGRQIQLPSLWEEDQEWQISELSIDGLIPVGKVQASGRRVIIDLKKATPTVLQLIKE